MKYGVGGAALVAVMTLAVACGDPNSNATLSQGSPEVGYAETTRARQACDRRVRTLGGPETVMAAAFETTVQAMAEWQRDNAEADAAAQGESTSEAGDSTTPSESDFVRQRPRNERLSVCYFDGPVYLPTPDERPQYNRARYLVDSRGETVPDAAGYHGVAGQAEMEFEDPESREPR